MRRWSWLSFATYFSTFYGGFVVWSSEHCGGIFDWSILFNTAGRLPRMWRTESCSGGVPRLARGREDCKKAGWRLSTREVAIKLLTPPNEAFIMWRCFSWVNYWFLVKSYRAKVSSFSIFMIAGRNWPWCWASVHVRAFFDVVASYWRWREYKEFSSLPSKRNIFRRSGVVDIIHIYNIPLMRRFCV
jgi:hypothetical protein